MKKGVTGKTYIVAVTDASNCATKVKATNNSSALEDGFKNLTPSEDSSSPYEFQLDVRDGNNKDGSVTFELLEGTDVISTFIINNQAKNSGCDPG